jgi:glycosyltransferase involved in cell wall biosynthesis
MNKVSVIIPSYNRFEELLSAINSIKKQTYKNIEIIVVNDRSSQKKY